MPVSVSSSVLPPANAAPVSADGRLAYVMRHFSMAYEAVPGDLIGYPGSHRPVEVADLAGEFFQCQEPYPAAPHYRAWAGQRVPFFFDAPPETPLLTLESGRARINADVVAAAFYLLSGWQEYFSEIRDRHGRFPYAASVQQRYGFGVLPVVNYYFEVLKTAVEHVTGRQLQARRWAGSAHFAAFISHDIDTLRSAWKAPAKAALQQGQLLKFGQLLWQHFSRPDAWDNLETVAAAVAEYGAQSTFFILPTHRPGTDGTPNADYILAPKQRQQLERMEQNGFEIGMHGSIGTATDAQHLAVEVVEFGMVTPGLRFHYLRWEPRQTPAAVDATQRFPYDSTLGFAEHFGFRHSYCLPFYLFNFATGKAHSFLEIPLNVMDVTLHHTNYLQLQAEEILPALQPMFAEIEKFGGVASILWHNDHFDPANTVTGPRQFAEIMRYLQRRGAAFLTGSQIVAELCDL